MRKNVAGQAVGCQMMTIADGAPFTGTVTIYITGDNGTQTIGSVGSGVCTHEGRGYHSYAPAQAESNFDHIAFTFDGGATAATATVQVYTTFPQTGDNFALIGTAGAGLTNINLPDQAMDIVGNITGNLSGSVGSVTGAVGSVTGLTAATVHSDLDDIQARLPAALTAGGNIKADALAWNGLATVALPATPTNITAGTITTVTNLTNAPTAGDLTATMKASVNAEVVDTLNVDTYAEPGQEAPPATTTLVKKIGWLYKAFRNRKTQTATTLSIFADDATTVDAKSTISDDGTTYSHGEVATGP